MERTKQLYARGIITEGEFRKAAVAYIDAGANDTERYFRAVEVDMFLDELAERKGA